MTVDKLCRHFCPRLVVVTILALLLLYPSTGLPSMAVALSSEHTRVMYFNHLVKEVGYLDALHVQPQSSIARLTHATHADQPATIRTATWLTMSHASPDVLYIGGVDTDTFFSACLQPCTHAWAMRSDNGGKRWVDITKSMVLHGTEDIVYAPIQISGDDHNLYVNVTTRISPDSDFADVLRSTDRGAHWSALDGRDHGRCVSDGYGEGFGALTLDPRVPERIYAVCYASDQGSGSIIDLRVSDDGGTNWISHTFPNRGMVEYTNQPQPGRPFVADRRRPDTIYANMPVDLHSAPGSSGFQITAGVMRSDDAGLHWTPVQPPPGVPLLSFGVTTNEHTGQALVGLTNAPALPRDRIYLSQDAGRTWRAGTCPGDFNHHCPRFTVDNVFGAGASYAFIGDGVRRFVGTGSALQPLALGALPFHTRDIVAVGAVSRLGGPVYVLTSSTLYRSADGGKTWAPQPVRRLP